MQTFILLCALFLSLSSSGCDQIYAFLDKHGAEEKQLIGEAYAFESNPKVSEIQKLLKLYGYDMGKVDGVLGGRTRQKIEQFQRDAGLPVTRFVDQTTWNALNVLREKQLVIDDKLNVVLIQQVLKDAGYPIGMVDGKWGLKTKEAVTQFQKTCGLNPDGKAGFKTLNALSRLMPKSS